MRICHLFLTTLTLLLSYSFSLGQSLVKEGHQWNVVHESFWGPGTSTELTRVTGDTIINDTVYNKLYSTRDTLGTNWKLRNELLREDAIGRVYTREIESGQEHLLFDFSLQLNDTFSIYLGRFATPDNECLAIVSNIDSTTINNGEKRKRIHFNIIWNGSLAQGPVWIEGVGSTIGGLFGDIWYCVPDIVLGLNCFYDNNEILFPESPSSCFIDISVAVQNLLPRDISIYPNPMSDLLYIKHGSTQLKSISIVNLFGVLVYERPYTESVDVSQLANGTYIVLLEDDRGNVYSDKIVKMQ